MSAPLKLTADLQTLHPSEKQKCEVTVYAIMHSTVVVMYNIYANKLYILVTIG